ncbi:MAG: hypothetical protein HUK14_06150 [Muribaculaceae bacterium]|nr:hypothetical protein [Muribaculaceae bacterium]
MKYYFDIEERLVKRVCVEASDEKTAYKFLSAMYNDEKIVLDADDFEEYSITGVDSPPERTVQLHISANVKSIQQP